MDMRTALLWLCALSSCTAANPVLVVEDYFNQKLDHMDPYSTETWTQRYYKMESFYKYGGPVFLHIGGEGEINIGLASSGLVPELAEKYSGVVYVLEHRYYGQSVPPTGFVDDTPVYLSSQQALADLALFIQDKMREHPGSTWIAIGCSYSGNLAAWLRLKYPHLVEGAVAGSAPVLAKADFHEYYEAVGELLEKKYNNCFQETQYVKEELRKKLGSLGGRLEIMNMFKLCSLEWVSSEYIHLYMAQAFGPVVQNNQYEQDNISQLCNKLQNPSFGDSSLERLAAVTPKINCSAVKTRSFTEYLNELQWTIGQNRLDRNSMDMFEYQMCTELGYFQTTTSNEQPFGTGMSLTDFIMSICTEKWGINQAMVEEAVSNTNKYYGGMSPLVSNVVFDHGSLDPWRKLGVVNDLSPSVRAFVVEGLSHCELHQGSSYLKNGSTEMLEAYMKIMDIVGGWLKQTPTA